MALDGLGPFRLDTQHDLLLRGSEPVALGRRAFALLRALVERPGAVISSEALISAAWPGRLVEESNLTKQIAALRRVLSEAPGGDRWIETMPRRGYRFVGPAIQEVQNEAIEALPTVKATPDLSLVEDDEAERRQVTAMSCELIGLRGRATAIDHLEDWREAVDAFQRFVRTTADRHSGFIARHLGSTILILFGYPAAHENDAERAVRAGLEIYAAVRALKPVVGVPMRCRVGIATGMVIVGNFFGVGERSEFKIIGDTPELAALLQISAEPDTLVIESATKHLLGNLFDYRDLDAITISCDADAVQRCRVIGERDVESRFDALRGSALSPLIGRDEEIGLLMRRWARAKAGSGQVVLISGEPGIGKSRIATALEERLHAEPHFCLRYFCSPHHRDSALSPFVDQLARASKFAPDDPPEIRFEKLKALFSRVKLPDENIVLLADLLSLRASACDPFPSLSPQLKKQRTLQALFQQLEGLSRRLPVVAVFEDAHWIDPTSRELLDLIVERLHALPVLLIVTFRPEFQAPWRGQPQVTDLALGPLDRRDRAALAAQVAGDKSLPDEVIAQIVDRTDGVPLFVEELTRSMLESGVLREEDDRFVLDETLKPLAIPTTLQASLMARLDRSAPLRRIAQVGAAIGREFSYTLISAVSRLSEVDLQAALDRLVASGLAFQRGAPPDAVYRFKHALVQDAAYSTLLRGKRRMLHATIAEKLTERFPESAETAPETIAQHLTEAGAYAAAADQWARAGALASRRAAYAEAVHHLGRGLSVLEQLPVGPERARCEAELHLRLAEVYRAKLGICAHEVSRSFKRALDLGDELKDDNIRAAAGNGYQNFLFNCGQLDASVQVCEELLNNFPSTDASLRMYLTHTLGCADYMRGNLATGQKHLEMAHSLFSAAKRPMGVDALQYDFVSAVNTQAHLATVYWLQGFIARSATSDAHALESARQLGQPFVVASALYFSLVRKALCRDYAAMAPKARELQALSEENGFPSFGPFSKFFVGCALVAERRSIEDGLSLMREGLEAQRYAGPNVNRAVLLATLADSLNQVGEIEAGLVTVQRGFDIAEVGEVRYMHAELLRLQGELSRAQGPAGAAAAMSLFRDAIDVACLQGSRSLQLRACVSLGRLWLAENRREEALALLRPIYGSFADGFNTLDLREAKALVDDLARIDVRAP